MKKKTLLLVIPFLLTACGGNSTANSSNGGCDPDDMFCEDTPSTSMEKIELEKDTNQDYILDKNVSNENASVNYEVFVRSFCDSNGDGIGDLNGLTSKLDYLKDLGVKNLWLMPINDSPSYHGYDVSDYYSINPDYGTMEDLENLVSEAKKHNIGIILDMVFNHSSTRNEWFKQSYEDYLYENPSSYSKATWYNWNNKSSQVYKHSYGGTETYYEGGFGSSMPDLNLDNEQVREEIKKISKKYIDIGVAGFRLDAVLYYYSNVNENVKFLSWLNDYCKSLNPDFYIVGECWSSKETINSYYSSGVDSFFFFPSSIEGTGKGSIISTVKGGNDAHSFGTYIEQQEKDMKAINPKAVSSYFLTNHDTDRASNSLYGYSAKAAASLIYLMPGTPYMYYGEEIGLIGVRSKHPDDQSDVKRRLPIIWSKNDKVGECEFPEKNRLDLDTTKQVTEGVYDQLETPYSLVNHYRKVLNIRNKYSFIRDAKFTNLTSLVKDQNAKVLVYKLESATDSKDSIIVVHNFDSVAVKVDLKTIGSEILEMINVSRKVPKLEGHVLSIGNYSTVILKA